MCRSDTKNRCEESRKQHANPISDKNVVTRKREKYQEIKGSISHLHDEQCQPTAKTTHSPSEHKALEQEECQTSANTKGQAERQQIRNQTS